MVNSCDPIVLQCVVPANHRQLWLALSRTSPPPQSSRSGKRKWFRTGGWSLLTAEISLWPLTNFNAFTPNKICLASLLGVWTQQELSGYFTVTLVSAEEGARGASLRLTCPSELLQVWNMAATETQLMLSVGLIGKCWFLFCLFYFHAELLPRLTAA